MRRWKAGVGLLAALVMTVALSACGGDDGGGSSASGTLKAGSAITPSSLDPIHSTSGVDYAYLNLLYDRILETDRETGDITPGLAVEWGYSDDKMTFDLKLREGVTFSDGTPVDAEAVKANLERGFDTVKVGPIVGVESVEVLSDTELRLHMNKKNGWLPYQLSGYAGYIVSPKAFESAEDVTPAPVGSGPYRLKSNSPGSQIVLEKNPDYWNEERGFFDQIEVKFYKTPVSINQALESGAIDVQMRTAFDDVETLKKNDDLVVEINPSLAVYHIQFNPVREGLKDPRVRQAFAYALDRESLAKEATAGLGEASGSIFPPGYKFSSERAQTMFAYDPDKAKQLLKEADKTEVELNCVTYTGSGFETAAPFILEDLAEVGIKVNLDTMANSEAIAAFAKGADVEAAKKAPDCMFNTWPGQPTPRDTLRIEYSKDGIWNLGAQDYMSQEKLDSLDEVFEEDEQVALVHELEESTFDNPMMANLYTKPLAVAYRKSVTGYEPDILHFDMDLALFRPRD